MLTKVMMQEILDLKGRGYATGEIPGFFEARGLKPPSMQTIRKYYDMDIMSNDIGKNLEKPLSVLFYHRSILQQQRE